jgi:hypothetical protein
MTIHTVVVKVRLQLDVQDLALLGVNQLWDLRHVRRRNSPISLSSEEETVRQSNKEVNYGPFIEKRTFRRRKPA